MAGLRNAVGRAPYPCISRSCVRYSDWPHTFVSPSTDSRGAVAKYWRKYAHEVLVNRLGQEKIGAVRLSDRPDMTLDVYRGRKTKTVLYNLQLILMFKNMEIYQ